MDVRPTLSVVQFRFETLGYFLSSIITESKSINQTVKTQNTNKVIICFFLPSVFFWHEKTQAFPDWGWVMTLGGDSLKMA